MVLYRTVYRMIRNASGAPENTNATTRSPTKIQCDIPSICPVLTTQSNQCSPLLVSLYKGKVTAARLYGTGSWGLRNHSYRIDRRIPSRPLTDRQSSHTICFVQNTDTQITLDFSQGQSSKAFSTAHTTADKGKSQLLGNFVWESVSNG